MQGRRIKYNRVETDDGKVPFKMSKRSADVRSAHHLVVTQLKLKLDATKKRKTISRKVDDNMLEKVNSS